MTGCAGCPGGALDRETVRIRGVARDGRGAAFGTGAGSSALASGRGARALPLAAGSAGAALVAAGSGVARRAAAKAGLGISLAAILGSSTASGFTSRARRSLAMKSPMPPSSASPSAADTQRRDGACVARFVIEPPDSSARSEPLSARTVASSEASLRSSRVGSSERLSAGVIERGMAEMR